MHDQSDCCDYDKMVVPHKDYAPHVTVLASYYIVRTSNSLTADLQLHSLIVTQSNGRYVTRTAISCLGHSQPQARNAHPRRRKLCRVTMVQSVKRELGQQGSQRKDRKYASSLFFHSTHVPTVPANVQVVSASLFKACALPLHVNVTHTPPNTGEENGPSVAKDSGFLGALTLQPSTFTTGSYRWKGSKRLTIELVDPDGEETKKVQVMLTCVSLGIFG